MTSDFPRRIYDEVKDLFPKGAVETFVCRGIPAGGEVHLLTVPRALSTLPLALR